MADGNIHLSASMRKACEGCAVCGVETVNGLCAACNAENKKIRYHLAKRAKHGRAGLPPILLTRVTDKSLSATRQQHTCVVCFARFYPKAKGRDKCCGRGCGCAFNGMQAALRKTGGRVFVSVKRKRCIGCGKMHGSIAHYCTHACKAANQKPAYSPVVSALCRRCGVRFDRREPGATLHMCSPVCADAAYAKAKRSGRAKRKALERGAQVGEVIDPIAVFERDGWRCGICGMMTIKGKRGTCHAKAPELDHIVALANGGKHTWGNVQCSCRKCNGAKGASDFGQLMLFPRAA